MTRDHFASVLGTGRGRQRSDTILTTKPSKEALEDFDAYMEELKEGNYTRSLQLLAEHSADISSLPLLRKLAGQIALAFVANSALALDEALRHFLDEIRVYPALSDNLVMTNLRPQSTGHKPGIRRLHLWPEGDQVGLLTCLTDQAQTTCGLEINRISWQRVPRGSWSANNLSKLRWDTCPSCQLACPPHLRYVLEESQHYVPFGHTLYQKILNHVTRQTVSRFATSTFRGEQELILLAQKTYRTMLAPATVAYIQKHEEPFVQRILGARRWRLLQERVQTKEAILETRELKEVVFPYIPHQEKDNVIQASDEELAHCREALTFLICEHAGIPELSQERA